MSGNDFRVCPECGTALKIVIEEGRARLEKDESQGCPSVQVYDGRTYNCLKPKNHGGPCRNRHVPDSAERVWYWVPEERSR